MDWETKTDPDLNLTITRITISDNVPEDSPGVVLKQTSSGKILEIELIEATSGTASKQKELEDKRKNQPPVICKIPAIKVALKGKCRRRTDSNTKERPHKKSSTTKSSASSAK